MNFRQLCHRVCAHLALIAGMLATASCAGPRTTMGEVATASSTEAAQPRPVNREAVIELLISRANPNVAAGAGPSVGDVFLEYLPGSKPVYVDGWEYEGGGFWGDPTSDDCCILRFNKDETWRVALTEWVTKPGQGEKVTVRILATETLALRPGEIFDDSGCPYEDRASQIAAVDRKRQHIRAVFWQDGQFHMREWTYRTETGCPSEEFGDE